MPHLPNVFKNVNLAEAAFLMAPFVKSQRRQITHPLGLENLPCGRGKDLGR